MLRDEERVRERWKEYFENLLNEEYPREQHQNGTPNQRLTIGVTRVEVATSLKKMNNKATGPDDACSWSCLQEGASGKRTPVTMVRSRVPQTPRTGSGAGPAKGGCPIPPGKLLSVEELAVTRTSKNKVKARAIQSSFMTRKQQPSVSRWSRGGGSLRSSCARYTLTPD